MPVVSRAICWNSRPQGAGYEAATILLGRVAVHVEDVVDESDVVALMVHVAGALSGVHDVVGVDYALFLRDAGGEDVPSRTLAYVVTFSLLASTLFIESLEYERPLLIKVF